MCHNQQTILFAWTEYTIFVSIWKLSWLWGLQPDTFGESPSEMRRREFQTKSTQSKCKKFSNHFWEKQHVSDTLSASDALCIHFQHDEPASACAENPIETVTIWERQQVNKRKRRFIACLLNKRDSEPLWVHAKWTGTTHPRNLCSGSWLLLVWDGISLTKHRFRKDSTMSLYTLYIANAKHFCRLRVN